MYLSICVWLIKPCCRTKSIWYCIERWDGCETVHSSWRSERNFEKINSFLYLKYLKKTYHTERTEVSSSGFGNSPDSNIRSSKDHHSRLHSSKWIQTSKKNNIMKQNIQNLPYSWVKCRQLPNHYCRRDSKPKEFPNSLENLHRNWHTGFRTGRRVLHV